MKLDDTLKECHFQATIYFSESKKDLSDISSRIAKLNDTSITFLLCKRNRLCNDEKGYSCVLLEFVDDKAKLVISAEKYEALQAEFKNTREDGTIIDNEFRVKLDDKQLYITGRYDSKMIMENGDICLLINSVGTLDGKEVYGDNEPEEMKRLLLSSKITDLEVKQHATDTSQSLNAQSL